VVGKVTVVFGVGAVTVIGPVTPMHEQALVYLISPEQGVAYGGRVGEFSLFLSAGSKTVTVLV
jgi:hypothetical protein